jgi:two-component system, LytTR family, response regulator
MPIKCVVVDDEDHILELMTAHVQNTPYLQLELATTNPIKAVKRIEKGDIDLVFTDVQMPEMSGIQLIEILKGKSVFIMCTAFRDYAYEGFEKNVADFILKPVTYARFIQSVEKVRALYLAHLDAPKYIMVKARTKHEQLRLDLTEIDYVESVGNYAEVNCGTTKYMARQNLKAMEEVLPPNDFIRIHNCYIINRHKILSIKGDKLTLKGQPVILSIGPTYRHKLNDIL